MDADGSITCQAQLNEFEESALQTGVNPSATITWCVGSDDVADAAAKHIQERLGAVLAKNPWLAGKIVKGDDGKHFLRYGSLDDDASRDEAVSRMFRYIPSSTLFSRRTPFRELGDILAAEGLNFGRHLDETKPMFLISVVKVERDDELAIVASMNHVVGDGCTYYAIYNMILHGAEMRALDPERVDLHRERQEEKMGKEEARLLSSAGFIVAALRGILSMKMFGFFSRRYEVKTRVHLIDNDRIIAVKEEVRGKDDVEFVSTNDILTSWFLANSNCQNGMMAVNLRGRLEGYDSDKAGNYENLIYYRIPEDCASSLLIRKSIEPLKRCVTSELPLPRWYQLGREDFGIITNWATFASDNMESIALEGSEVIGHLPVYDLSVITPSIATAVIFRYAPDTTGILLMGTDAQLEGLSSCDDFLDSQRKVECHF